jgi:hypothetical protein
MNNKFTVYPRLYTSRSPGSGVVSSTGDVTVDTLHGFLTSRSVNTSAWDFKKRVLLSAVRLFGDFNQWIKDQRNNPQITGWNLGFLADTLQYIRTGVRDVSVQNWVDLLAESNQHSPQANHLTTPTLALAASETTIMLIQQWCSHPGGLEDMLATLHVLFGSARQKLA